LKHQSTDDSGFRHDFFQYFTEFFVADVSVDSGAGVGNSVKVIFVGKNRRMQRPLGTAPRSAVVHPAAIVIKYTMAIYDFHLYDVPRYPPVRLLYLVRPQLKNLYHPLLVFFIKGDGGFTMAAVAAAGTGKYNGR
jgi:hypothetical protein